MAQPRELENVTTERKDKPALMCKMEKGKPNMIGQQFKMKN